MTYVCYQQHGEAEEMTQLVNELILEWLEAGQVKIQMIYDQQPSKAPGVIRLGRDPARCDILLSHPTVSGLQAEIFFDPKQNGFWLRSLRDSNPAIVDGKRLTEGEALLRQGGAILLGQLQLKIVQITIAPLTIPPTVLGAPTGNPSAPSPPTTSPTEGVGQTYGLMCPMCHQVSSYECLETGCCWCGTSLAAAASILMVPN